MLDHLTIDELRSHLDDLSCSLHPSADEQAEAIRFLLAYGPAVLGSSEQLRNLADGMTGAELIARAKGLAETRYGNAPNRN